MRAVEFTIELNGERVVTIPDEVAAGLPKTGPARVIILTGDSAEDAQWRRAAYEQFARDDAPGDAAYDTYKQGVRRRLHRSLSVHVGRRQ